MNGQLEMIIEEEEELTYSFYSVFKKAPIIDLYEYL